MLRISFIEIAHFPSTGHPSTRVARFFGDLRYEFQNKETRVKNSPQAQQISYPCAQTAEEIHRNPPSLASQPQSQVNPT